MRVLTRVQGRLFQVEYAMEAIKVSESWCGGVPWMRYVWIHGSPRARVTWARKSDVRELSVDARRFLGTEGHYPLLDATAC